MRPPHRLVAELGDLDATRMISSSVPTLALTLTSAASGMIAGLVLWPFEIWRALNLSEAGLLALAGLFLAIGYALIIVALRTGDVGTVSPFRYAVILCALASGYLVWGQTPDGLAMIGIVIVCAAGLYTVHRERVRRKDERATLMIIALEGLHVDNERIYAPQMV